MSDWVGGCVSEWVGGWVGGWIREWVSERISMWYFNIDRKIHKSYTKEKGKSYINVDSLLKEKKQKIENKQINK